MSGPMKSVIKEVILKFMKLKDHFQREVSCRDFLDSDKYIVPLECAYDGDSVSEESTRFFEDSYKKGYRDYDYCIVIGAANTTLKRVMEKHTVAGRDWEMIRQTIRQLTSCLAHLHSNGIVHGDIKRKCGVGV